MTVRTRFAPSPTGYLHIGGVRTALFNWLFSRQHGGQFLLRIDDTDQQRNIAEALQPILDGFRWLGIDWDEGPEVGGPHAPYFQSQRHEAYRAAVARLLEAGHAYRDYATTEEIQAERTAAEKDKRAFLYSRTWMAETDADASGSKPRGARESCGSRCRAKVNAAFTTSCAATSRSTGPTSRITSCSARTAPASITWRARSTITTSASRT